MNSQNPPRPGTFRNPLIQDGADPWMVWHDGYYYLTASAQTHIEVRRARSITAIHAATPVVVWRDETPTRDQAMWAPEFYLLDGPNGKKWYLYYCASGGKPDDHRPYVLEGQGDTPLGPYQFKAQLQIDPADRYFGIDATVLQTGDGALYCIWAGQPRHELHISRMENPYTLVGPRAHLPAEGWGCPECREGPVCLRRDGRVFLFYSACDARLPDYKVGLLIANENSDLLDAASWQQYPQPILTRCDANGVYGPGHNSFFQSPDNRETWILYHGKESDALTFEGRSARAQRLEWRDGLPFVGDALPLSSEISVPSGDVAEE